MADIDVDAIETQANAATEGPWQYLHHGSWGGSSAVATSGGHPLAFVGTAEVEGVAVDGEFIAAARTDVPALVAEVRRLRSQRNGAIRIAEGYRTERDTILAQRDAVLALHQKASPSSYLCRCRHQWPCRTLQALGVTE